MSIEIDDEILKQLEEIRLSGETNMFDFHTVHRLAYDRKYYDLVIWMDNNKEKYWKGIRKGFKPI